MGTRTPRESGDIPGNTLEGWGHLGESGTTWGDRHAEVTGDMAHTRGTGNTLEGKGAMEMGTPQGDGDTPEGTGDMDWGQPKEMGTLWRDREHGDGEIPWRKGT